MNTDVGDTTKIAGIPAERQFSPLVLCFTSIPTPLEPQTFPSSSNTLLCGQIFFRDLLLALLNFHSETGHKRHFTHCFTNKHPQLMAYVHPSPDFRITQEEFPTRISDGSLNCWPENKGTLPSFCFVNQKY